MPLKRYNPTSPGRRFMTSADFTMVTTDEPHKPLLEPLRKRAGRNNQGRVTTRHQGGGAKRYYRIIDFKRDKDGVPGRIATVEYDPNRTARIALVHYADGEKRYILAPESLKVGDAVQAGQGADIRAGNALKLKDIPLGVEIHNIELKPGKGGQLVRSAGGAAMLMAREGRYATIRLPSGEMRLVLAECRATIGRLGNADHQNVSWGKAGRSRLRGIRPSVRGSAMNPVDHPHGGGEGRSKGGRHPVTPWGQPTKGKKTRLNKRTDRFIVTRRSKGYGQNG